MIGKRRRCNNACWLSWITSLAMGYNRPYSKSIGVNKSSAGACLSQQAPVLFHWHNIKNNIKDTKNALETPGFVITEVDL